MPTASGAASRVMPSPSEILEFPRLPGGPAAAASPRVSPTRRPRPALVAAAVAVAALALLPAVYLVIRAAGAGAGGIAETLFTARIAGLLLRTTLLCAAVTATAVAIALPVAWLTMRTDLPGRRAWVVVSALPLVIPSYVGGYAFAAALGPRGLLQGWLEPLGVERLPAIYGFGGAWLVLSLFTYPLVLLPVRAALASSDPSLEEASRALGRGRRATLLRVTLPQLRPATVSGALLVALYTLSDFGAVSLMRFDSLSRAIFVTYRSSFDRTHAAVLGLILVGLTTSVLVIELRTRGRGVQHSSHRGVRRPPHMTQLGAWRWPGLAVCGFVVGLALLVPVTVIAVWLGRGIASGVSFDLVFVPAVRSMQASVLGAGATVVCAWPIALLAARYKGSVVRLTETSASVGYALPGIVIALSLVFFGARLPFIYQTLFLLVLAYVVHFLAQATGTLRASIAQIHPGIEEAARSLGAGPGEVLRRVTLPLIRPGVLTAFALVFLTVMKELPATLLLAPAGFHTLATEVWDAAAAGSFAKASVPALALVLLSSAPMAVLVAREQRQTAYRPSGW